MRAEIITRCNQIITNDTALTGIFRVYENEYPATLHPPCVLILPRQDSGYQKSGGRSFLTEVQFDMHVFLAPVGTRLTAINSIEAVTLPDLFADAFLSRPQLQYNDNGIEDVVEEIRFQIASDLARPLQYPLGIPEAPRYWGFIVRLTIPYRQTIPMKVKGV